MDGQAASDGPECDGASGVQPNELGPRHRHLTLQQIMYSLAESNNHHTQV